MLVGRASEVAALDGFLARVRGERGGARVLWGEPGIGKSALLDHVAAHAADCRVLRDRGVASERRLPFAGLQRLLGGVLERAEQVPATQRAALRGALGLDAAVAADRFLISLAVLSLLAAIAEDGPLLVVVDDADGLDPESSDALAFVGRRLLAEPVGLLLAARTGDGASPVAEDLPAVAVAGLGSAASLLVLDDAVGPPVTPDVARQLVVAAQGNPLALRELPGQLTADQAAGRVPLPDPLAVGAVVQAAFMGRARLMPAATRRALLIAAVDDTGDPGSVVGAARLAGLGAGDFEPAELAGLVCVDEHAIVFRHPLVRSAVYQAATFAQRRSAHLAVAGALRGDANADRRAWHRAAAALGPSDGVADDLERSADRAKRRSGHVAAAAALERSAELTADEGRRVRRLTRAAESAWRGGRSTRALALVERAEALAPTARLRADLQHIRGGVELRCGSPAEGCARLLAGADEVAATDPRKALDMLVDAAEAASHAGDVAATVDAGARARRLAVESDEARFVVGLVGAVAALMEGRSAATSAQVVTAIAGAEAVDEPRWLAWAGIAAGLTGQDGAELALYRRASALARRSAAVTSLTGVLAAFGFSGVLAGRHSAVAADAAEGLRLAREAGLVNVACHHLATLALVAAIRGREDECLAHALEVTDVASSHGLGLQNAMAEWARALLDLGAGRFAASVDRLEHMTHGGGRTTHPFVVLMAAPDLVEAAARSDRPHAAGRAMEELERFTSNGAPRWVLAVRSRCRGLVASGADAEEHFEEAVRLHRGSDRAFDRARTGLVYGEHIRRLRHRVRAREHLRSAIDGFDRVGARAWGDRARNELRATGESARRRACPVSDELTPQEQQVARFVADGASNKEVAGQLFLSPRTVEYHLRKVFMKLGISSRAELMLAPLTEHAAAGADR
jgi:DNA-binding NarL/FixJ family response regulator/tetratricopeptide (TPR) repeat protein